MSDTDTPSSINRALARAGLPAWLRRLTVWLLSVGGISGIVAGIAALAPHIGDWMRYLSEHPMQAVVLIALSGVLLTVAGLTVALALVWRRLDTLHVQRLEDAVAREQRSAEREVARARADERLADVLDRVDETLNGHGRLIAGLTDALRRHMDEHHPDDTPMTGASAHPDRRDSALDPRTETLPFPTERDPRMAATRPMTPFDLVEHG